MISTRNGNLPRAGRGGPGQYSKLHWRTMPQDTCANEPVNATDPQVEPLPAAIREGEDEFIVSNTAGGVPPREERDRARAAPAGGARPSLRPARSEQ